MLLCKVTGTIVSSRKDENFSSAKLLVVHPVDVFGELDGVKDMLAIDPGFGAGPDDVVLVAREGAVVRQLMNSDKVPANVVILGVVDSWTYEA